MQLDILHFLQSFSTPLLNLVAMGLTMLGEPVVLATVFCAVYWCHSKEIGRGLLYTLCASLCINGIIKDMVRAPRPIGQEGIRSLRVHTATGYSFPSGHTQSTAAFWTALALWGRRRVLWALAVLLVVLVGWSRMYLGLHYPVDVLGGLVGGSAVAGAMHRLLNRGHRKIALLLCFALAAGAFLLGESADTFKSAGMVLGMFAGGQLEARLGSFETASLSLREKAVRLGLGLLLLGILYLLLKVVVPSGPLWDALRYGFVVFWGVGAYPCLCARLKL